MSLKWCYSGLCGRSYTTLICCEVARAQIIAGHNRSGETAHAPGIRGVFRTTGAGLPGGDGAADVIGAPSVRLRCAINAPSIEGSTARR
jgi:hypothetical protein